MFSTGKNDRGMLVMTLNSWNSMKKMGIARWPQTMTAYHHQRQYVYHGGRQMIMQVFQVHSEANKLCSASGENFIPQVPFS